MDCNPADSSLSCVDRPPNISAQRYQPPNITLGTFQPPNISGRTLQPPNISFGEFQPPPVSNLTVSVSNQSYVHTFMGPCGEEWHDELDRRQAQLAGYLRNQTMYVARRARERIEEEMEKINVAISDEVSDMVATVARAIFEDIRFASNIYIFYIIFVLWIPAPFAVCKENWKEAYRTSLLHLSKLHFVIAACVVMWGWVRVACSSGPTN